MKMIHTGGPYGDGSSSYDVKLDKEYTVQDFMEEILAEKPGEWGTFKVYKNLKRAYEETLDVCDYKQGKITNCFSLLETGKKKVKEVIAHGGWTNMDYFIKAE